MRNINHSYFETESSESCYIAGYLMADGCISMNSSGNFSVQLNVSVKDDEIARFILSRIAPDRIITYQSVKLKSGIISQYSRFKVTSNQLCDSLSKLNIIPRKTGFEIIPNVKFINDFIRGLFDGDGSIALKKRGEYTLSIASASETLINQLIEILGYGRKEKHKNANCYCWVVSKRDDIEKFMNFIYYENCVHLSRKKVIFDTMPLHTKYSLYNESKSIMSWSKDSRCEISYWTLRRRLSNNSFNEDILKRKLPLKS